MVKLRDATKKIKNAGIVELRDAYRVKRDLAQR
jgi:hypothetical protein